MATPKSEFEKQMQHLESEIRRLEAEFNMFFAGRLPRPPWETKTRVAALVKRYDQSYLRNTADRFRFESLQNRHQKFLELVDRQMTNRELGRPMLGVKIKAEEKQPEPKAGEATEAAAASGTGDPAKTEEQKADQPKVAKPRERKETPNVVTFGKGGDEQAVNTRTKELYERLAAAKKEAGEQPVALERIQALVRQQVDKFASQGKEVAFKVAVKDGKVTLTAKASEDKD